MATRGKTLHRKLFEGDELRAHWTLDDGTLMMVISTGPDCVMVLDEASALKLAGFILEAQGFCSTDINRDDMVPIGWEHT